MPLHQSHRLFIISTLALYEIPTKRQKGNTHNWKRTSGEPYIPQISAGLSIPGQGKSLTGTSGRNLAAL